jgi:site-specific DNA recombinase
MPNVHIYCRVSSDGQEDNTSLGTQEAACRKWADERGHVVASVAREVKSGGDRVRPALDRIIDDCQPGDIVLSYALDRFSRSQTHTAVLIDRIEQAGASLQLATEDYEKSATGIFLSKRARVASGKPLVGARPRYGYQWNADKTAYVLDPIAAPIVRQIFDWALAGASLKGIATRLEDQRVSSPKGATTWCRGRLRDLLRCPTYAGNVTAYRTRFEKDANGVYRQRAATDAEMVSLPGIAPAIVTEAEQAEVIARLVNNKATATRNNRNPEAALLRAGFIFCGVCGKAGSARNGRKHRPNETTKYETCHNATCGRARIVAPELDAVVWQRVSAVLRDPAIIARELDKHRNDGGLERELDALDKRIAANVSKQAALAQAIAHLDDPAPIYSQLNALSAGKKALEQDRAALVRRLEDAASDAVKVRNLEEWCRHVVAKLDTATYAQRRTAFEALGVTVRIWPEGATDDAGTSLPRCEMTMQPLLSADPIVYRSSRHRPIPPPVPTGRRRARSAPSLRDPACGTTGPGRDRAGPARPRPR